MSKTINLMNRLSHIVLYVFLTGICTIKAQEYPQVIFPGDYPDPSILRDGKDFYMTHSSFSYSPGFLIWHSRDLVNWEPVCRVKGTGMAPDLVKYEDTYYLYYPWGSTNYVTYAKDIRGPWSKPVNLNVKGIDPGHIVDRDGNRYLHLSEGTAVRLSKDGLSVVGEPTTVYEGWQYPPDWDVECFCLESPKLTYRNGFYYLTSAEGGTAGPATSHMAVSARSKSITGPWENSPYNPIVHTYSSDDEWWSKGHATIFDDADGNWWIVYHAYKKDMHTLGRSTLLEPLEWTSDGWFKTKETAHLPEIANDKPRHLVSDISDDFTSDEINLRWATLGGTPKGCTKLHDGILTLQGKGGTPADGRVLLAIPADENYETQVEFELKDSETSGGLLLFYKPVAFAGITCNKGNVKLYRSPDNFSEIPNEIGARMHLKIINKRNICSFYISTDGNKWNLLASDVDVKDMNHNKYNGFRSLRIALYAGGTGTVDFKNFIYKKL